LFVYLKLFFLPAASFYPGLNGVDSILDIENDSLADSMTDEVLFEDENDWIDVHSTVQPSRVQTSKFSEALALEVSAQHLMLTFKLQCLLQQPIWNMSRSMSGQSEPPFHTPTRDVMLGADDTSLIQGTGLTVPSKISSKCHGLHLQTENS
jgi:hypothetical protein